MQEPQRATKKVKVSKKAAQAVVTGGGEVGGTVGGFFLGNHRIRLQDLYTIWRNSVDLFAAVREISENVGQAGYKWLNATDAEKDPNPGSVKVAEFVLNAKKTFRSLKRNIMRDAYVAGSSFIHLEMNAGGKPLGLQEIDPRTLKVVTDKYGTIIKWIQQVKADTVMFEPNEILPFSMFSDPDNPVFGISPVETAVWEIRSDQAAVINNYAFFQNSAVPAAQYILEEGLSDAEVKKTIELINDQLKGSENRHKSAALKGVKEIKVLGISPKDMEHEVLRRLTTEKVCAMTGVPKSILGYTDDVNLANGQEQTQKFWEGTINPVQEALAEWVNTKLLPVLGISDIKLEFETRSFDDREWNEASTRADVQNGILTINEARKFRGLPEFDEAIAGEFVNKPMVYGVTVTPIEDVGVDLSGSDPMNGDQIDAAVKMIDQYAKTRRQGRADQPKGH